MIVAVCGFAAFATADVAYNNFSSGDSYDTTGWVIGGGGGQGIAMGFTSLKTGKVSLLTVGVSLAGSISGVNLDISINADSAGLPGGALESWNGIAPNGTVGATTVLTGNGSLSLVAGTTYWVVMLPGQGSQPGSWGQVKDGSTGFAYNFNGGPWTTNAGPRSVFRVETQAVPEPTTFAALGLGAIALAARRRRKA